MRAQREAKWHINLTRVSQTAMRFWLDFSCVAYKRVEQKKMSFVYYSLFAMYEVFSTLCNISCSCFLALEKIFEKDLGKTLNSLTMKS